MFLLSTARGAFLEFLRNMGPQIFLLAIFLVQMTKLNFGVVDLSNFASTVAFYLVGLVLVFAMIANSLHFMEGACKHIYSVDEMAKELRRQGVSTWAILKAMFSAVRKNKASVAVEVIIAVLVVNVGTLIVVVLGMSSAVTFIRLVKSVGVG